MTEKNIRTKSYDFALKIIELYRKMPKEKQDFFLSKQLLRSGTAIGAKLETVSEKNSKKDLFLQLNLSSKDVHETSYLLRLLNDIGYLSKEHFSTLILECDEIAATLKEMISRLKKFPL